MDYLADFTLSVGEPAPYGVLAVRPSGRETAFELWQRGREQEDGNRFGASFLDLAGALNVDIEEDIPSGSDAAFQRYPGGAVKIAINLRPFGEFAPAL